MIPLLSMLDKGKSRCSTLQSTCAHSPGFHYLITTMKYSPVNCSPVKLSDNSVGPPDTTKYLLKLSFSLSVCRLCIRYFWTSETSQTFLQIFVAFIILEQRKQWLFMSCCKTFRGLYSQRLPGWWICVCCGEWTAPLRTAPSWAVQTTQSESKAHCSSSGPSGLSLSLLWLLSFPYGYMTRTVWWNFNCHPCLAEKFSDLMLPPNVAKK